MTANEFHKRINAFLASSGLPAWLEGHVPDGQACPYIVYGAACGSFGQAGALTATAWFDGADAAVQRAAFADTAEALLPRSGVKLIGDGGMIIIRRDEKAFMEMSAREHDPRLMGCKVNAVISMYG